MKNKYIILIATLVIVLLIVIGVLYLNLNVLKSLETLLGKKSEAYLDYKSKIQLVTNLCGIGALATGISGLILFAKQK